MKEGPAMNGGHAKTDKSRKTMRVVVATDGSPEATQAVEWLTQFPLPPGAAIDVVSAIPWPESTTKAGRELWKHAAAMAEDARARLSKRWKDVGVAVDDGDPRTVITDAAAARTSDLVVVGARSLGVVASALLGSVSLGVARHAPCAVLVCKGGVRPLRTVTVALDGSLSARAALDYFAALPLAGDLVVRLLGVVEPLRYPSVDLLTPQLVQLMKEYEDERRGELERVLAIAAADLRGRVRKVTTTTLVGQAAPSILSEAAKQPSDLIVVGARGLGTVKRLLLGSVSESVLRHASCSVLIVRAKEDADLP
jgi:nucleotide-binding universal stress UspA family protein